MTAEGVDVIEVSSKKDLNDFITLPSIIYSQDPFYVPPLLKEIKDQFSSKNPFFFHATARYFMARKNGKRAGRIIAFINKKHNDFHNEKTGFFGFFESVNDQEVATALLDTASQILKKEGMNILRGPMNFSTNEECGFLTEGFDQPPLLMTPYNPSYYRDLLEGSGMKKAKDLYAYIYHVQETLPEKVLRVASIAEKRGIRVRPISKKRFQDEMLIFKDVYTSAWEKNWGFIPPTREEIVHMGHRLKSIVVPDLTLVAEKDNEPVGFMGLLPDFYFVLRHMNGKLNPLTIAKALYYSRKIKDLRLLLLGIKPEYRNKGVDALIYREGFKGIKKGGYRRVEFSWILEDNIPIQRIVEMFGATIYKKYRVYEKSL